ncbi:MAG: glycosyltransferase family 2 protein [Dechloromonas sp.]|nr:MAG: glycosyltransferase family 2 protein [Dechloromonas sp.]
MKLCSVVVLYRPDGETLDFLRASASRANPVVAVWNACPSDQKAAFAGVDGLTLCPQSTNVGLSRALNIGIETAFAAGADRVLLLDQDSRPDASMGEALAEIGNLADREGVRVGLVGPTLRDRKASGAVNAVRTDAGRYQIVPSLSTSGSLIDKQAYRAVGPMWDDLFIDGIDHEWCYRAKFKGFSIVQARDVSMEHDMGDAGVNVFGRYKPIHRSPVRHYHIVRNILWLARQRQVPKSFSAKEVCKLAYRIPAYIAVSTARGATMSNIFRGIRHGLFGTPAKVDLEF